MLRMLAPKDNLSLVAQEFTIHGRPPSGRQRTCCGRDPESYSCPSTLSRTKMFSKVFECLPSLRNRKGLLVRLAYKVDPRVCQKWAYRAGVCDLMKSMKGHFDFLHGIDPGSGSEKNMYLTLVLRVRKQSEHIDHAHEGVHNVCTYTVKEIESPELQAGTPKHDAATQTFVVTSVVLSTMAVALQSLETTRWPNPVSDSSLKQFDEQRERINK